MKVSVAQLHPALDAVRVFGSPNFQIHDSVGFDRWNSIDFGAERDFPDMAFNLFRTLSYNKGVKSKSV